VSAPNDHEAPAVGGTWLDRHGERSRSCMALGVGQLDFCDIEFQIVL
jgi:hypothetical protein